MRAGREPRRGTAGRCPAAWAAGRASRRARPYGGRVIGQPPAVARTVEDGGDARPAPGREGMPRVGWAIGGLAVLLGLLALVLQLGSGVPLETGDLLFLLVDAAVAVVYGTVAGVVLARRRHPVGWLVALAALGGGLAALGGAWTSWVSTHPGTLPLPALEEAYGRAWVPGTVALFTVVPWLVRDHRASAREAAGTALGVAAAAWLTVDSFLAPPTGVWWALVAVVGAGAVTAVAVLVRHLRGRVEERPGLGLLAAGTALMTLSFVPLLLPAPPEVLLPALPLAHLACQALFPVAILTSVLRNRLWGLDLAVSRAAVAALLALALAVVYGVVLGVASLAAGDSPVVQVGAAVAVALAVEPVHRRVRDHVRRLVYGEATSPGAAALRLGAGMHEDDALAGLATALGESLRLESVRLVVPAPGTGPGAEATWGTPSSPPLVLPVRHAGALVAHVELTPRPGERLDRRTQAAVERLEAVLAAGVALVVRSRALVVATDRATRARLAERQAVRRELHDGLGPWLAGLRLGLAGARNLVGTDPVAAAEVLETLSAEAARRVEDVRTLARRLLPPVLEELGLAAALEETAARHRSEGFDVRLAVPEGLRLDDRVAAAAWAVTSEAVLNAARHSGASGCDVRVAVEADVLVVVCRDDGRGVGAAHDGVGTRSMHERVAELGGAFERRTGADGVGTWVEARFPLAPVGVA